MACDMTLLLIFLSSACGVLRVDPEDSHSGEESTELTAFCAYLIRVGIALTVRARQAASSCELVTSV